MTAFFDHWDAKRHTPAAAPSTPAPIRTDGNAHAYAIAALKGEVENLLAVPIGSGRNDQLNKSALKMYGYVEAGVIDERTVTETLGAADGGLDYPATRKTLESAREAARRHGAKHIPASTTSTPTQASRELAPWEQSDDPLADNFVEPHLIASATVSPTGSASAAPAHASTTGTPSSSSATTTGDPSPTSAPDAASPSTDPAHLTLVTLEATQQRVRRDARRMLDHEDAAREFRVPPYLPTLTDELAIPDEPVSYVVDDVIPTGANVLLTAQFKTGKTTMINNLAAALADGDPFLGKYRVDQIDGRIALFNYEVDGRQYRRWLRDAGIENTDRVAVLNLRGYRLPMLVPHIETWVVEWLKRAEAAVWVVDPFARAFTGSGDSENDNTAVGAFLDALDVVKERAGVGELILPTHTGRAEHEVGEERARGATRLDDWADVRWLLTKDKTDTRYFRATGRDVDTDEAALAFDPSTRRLTLTGGDRRTNEREGIRNAALTIITNRPGVGVSDLRDAVRTITGRSANKSIDAAVAELVGTGQAHTVRNGHAIGHYPGRAPAT